MNHPDADTIRAAINGPTPPLNKWLIDERVDGYIPFRADFGYSDDDPRFDSFDAAAAYIEQQGGELL